MSIKNYNIEIPKMNYQIIEISLKEDGVETTLDDTDNIFFTVKRNVNDIEPVIQKSLNNGIKYNEETKKYEIEITSEDTKDMQMGTPAGLYGYDITIYYGGNKPKQKVIGSLRIGNQYTLNEVV